MKKLLYNWARRIVASRMEEGTQLTSKHLEDNGWIYRDGYWIDPKANDEKRVHVKFQPGLKFDKLHYYKVYHCVQQYMEENINPFSLNYFTTESSVEWLETHLLCINKKPDKLI